MRLATLLHLERVCRGLILRLSGEEERPARDRFEEVVLFREVFLVLGVVLLLRRLERLPCSGDRRRARAEGLLLETSEFLGLCNRDLLGVAGIGFDKAGAYRFAPRKKRW